MPERPNPSLSANSQALKYKGLIAFTSFYREWAIRRSAFSLTFWRKITRLVFAAVHRVTLDAAAKSVSGRSRAASRRDSQLPGVLALEYVGGARYSITRKSMPSYSPTSWGVQMCGCVRLEIALHFAAKPCLALRVGGHVSRQDLDRHRSIEPRVPRATEGTPAVIAAGVGTVATSSRSRLTFA